MASIASSEAVKWRRDVLDAEMEVLHEVESVLAMERLASRWGIEPASVVRYQEEGRSRRLWPGLRLEEFMARIASAPAATEEPASPQQP